MTKLELYLVAAAGSMTGTLITLAVVGWYLWKLSGV